MFKLSKRIQELPPYLFVEIDKAKRKAKQEGRDIIDLGIGDPDLPTPDYIIDALDKAARDPANHHYALDQGMPALREAISDWYKKRFSVTLDPEKEILPLIGSKEGIAHFPLAFINQGDYSLVPDPCYPPYKGGTILAGGSIHLMPLKEQNAFLPDLKAIPDAVIKKSKLVYVNYPNNPTSACADKNFYDDLVKFGEKNNLAVISDLAYSEIAYDGYKPLSFLEVNGAKNTGIEFHSLSKTFNMTGWRIGFACGNASLIAGLAKVKSNIDSGIFSAIQLAAVKALGDYDAHLPKTCAIYKARRDLFLSGLKELGLETSCPKATFYLWIKVPDGKGSIEFSKLVLDKADIVVTPGVGFGESGEGYFRIALTVKEDLIREALKRLKRVF